MCKTNFIFKKSSWFHLMSEVILDAGWAEMRNLWELH
jgi:hypothetical protein